VVCILKTLHPDTVPYLLLQSPEARKRNADIDQLVNGRDEYERIQNQQRPCSPPGVTIIVPPLIKAEPKDHKVQNRSREPHGRRKATHNQHSQRHESIPAVPDDLEDRHAETYDHEADLDDAGEEEVGDVGVVGVSVVDCDGGDDQRGVDDEEDERVGDLDRPENVESAPAPWGGRLGLGGAHSEGAGGLGRVSGWWAARRKRM